MQLKEVQAYSLINFLTEYDKAKAEGFEFSDQSGFAPVEIGGFYLAVMTKPDLEDAAVQEIVPLAQEETKPSSEEDKEDTPEVKRGRKPKA